MIKFKVSDFFNKYTAKVLMFIWTKDKVKNLANLKQGLEMFLKKRLSYSDFLVVS